MRWVRSGAEVSLLFAGGLAVGLAAQAIGLWPTSRPAAVDPAPVQGSSAFADPTVTGGRSLSTTIVSLEGDGDAVRDPLRRAVILTARASLAFPCDLERRAALAITVRDYARAWGAAPSTAGRRAGFMTPLDDEAVRAMRVARSRGLLDDTALAGWPLPEARALPELLPQAGANAAPPRCAGAQGADRAGLRL